MYTKRINSIFKKKVKKVKNIKEQEKIWKKMDEISKTLETNPNHYKNLHPPLKKFKRVHVNGCYVILFRVNQNTKEVFFENYAHHDEIYIKK